MKHLSIVLSLIVCTLFTHAQETAKPASDILAEAYKKATAEKKNVILMFHASWCGWCHKMDSSMNDISCKKFFDDNYVTVHLTVEESAKNKNLENPGAAELKKQYMGEKAGLPFWLVLDNNGKLIGDSYMRKTGVGLDMPGDNIGCPASAPEVAAFVQILKKSSKLTDKELEIITTRFRKNE